MNIIFIFTPKLDNYADNTAFYDHLVTVMNATTLLSSVIKVILSKFRSDESNVVDTTLAVNQLVDIVKKIRYLVDPDPERNYKVRGKKKRKKD